ncbi:MAG: protein-glutamate O-methyltransferase CheR [Gammaproteobacteria bacterium]|nr:protein-glutamate O-methyltransferase CheR [Gammaproteobacteria bacterium]MCF6230230.1 protein-glutamate O-methyltransferase CheR [Gammaproteobacteria bacterium]
MLMAGIGYNVIEQQTMAETPDWMNSINEMDDQEFLRWSCLLKQRTGMDVRYARKSFLTTGVRLRMRELDFTCYSDYYQYLLSGRNGKIEWTTLVDRLTIHETRFFRHPSSIKLLTEAFLPDYIRSHLGENHLQAWSVGCATGEESYTLAIALDDYLKRFHPNIYYGVVGSDISLPALAKARKGVYDALRVKEFPQPLLARYLTKKEGGKYQVDEAVRKRVCFNMLNLLEMDQSTIHKMDIVFCQNVLIYFDKNLRHTILDKLVKHINPGGILVIGVGEAIDWKHPQMQRLHGYDALAYTKETIHEQ